MAVLEGVVWGEGGDLRLTMGWHWGLFLLSDCLRLILAIVLLLRSGSEWFLGDDVSI